MTLIDFRDDSLCAPKFAVLMLQSLTADMPARARSDSAICASADATRVYADGIALTRMFPRMIVCALFKRCAAVDYVER